MVLAAHQVIGLTVVRSSDIHRKGQLVVGCPFFCYNKNVDYGILLGLPLTSRNLFSESAPISDFPRPA